MICENNLEHVIKETNKNKADKIKLNCLQFRRISILFITCYAYELHKFDNTKSRKCNMTLSIGHCLVLSPTVSLAEVL